MEARRGTTKLTGLCRGPGRLVQAMGINKAMNGMSLTEPPFQVLPATAYPGAGEPLRMITTTRIGITQGADLPYRYYVEGSPFVSFPVRKATGEKK
jgi:DNA-3-methyladenine glycosylase